jgi:hypothetical protein
MDLFSESKLEHDGARAAAHGQSWRTNPFLQTQNMPQATGDSLCAWSCRHDAWQRGFESYFQLGPEFARRHKEKLSADLLRTLVERRLQWLPSMRAYMARHPWALLRLPSPTRHERDLEGRNWDLGAAGYGMTGSSQIDSELRTLVDRLRGQYDLLSSPMEASALHGRVPCVSRGADRGSLSAMSGPTDTGNGSPGKCVEPMTPQPCPAPRKAPETSDEATSSASAMQELELRTELGIRRIGWRYEYRGYRYDRLADAVAYARLDREGQGGNADPGGARLADEAPQLPGAQDLLLMARWAIAFEAGIYRFQDYRYERLCDAVAYAQLLESRQSEPAPRQRASQEQTP